MSKTYYIQNMSVFVQHCLRSCTDHTKAGQLCIYILSYTPHMQHMFFFVKPIFAKLNGPPRNCIVSPYLGEIQFTTILLTLERCQQTMQQYLPSGDLPSHTQTSTSAGIVFGTDVIRKHTNCLIVTYDKNIPRVHISVT